MLYQNVVVSNKCVKELVGRTDTFSWSFFGYLWQGVTDTTGKQASNKVLSSFQLQEQQRGRWSDSARISSEQSALGRFSPVPVEDDRWGAWLEGSELDLE